MRVPRGCVRGAVATPGVAAQRESGLLAKCKLLSAQICGGEYVMSLGRQWAATW